MGLTIEPNNKSIMGELKKLPAAKPNEKPKEVKAAKVGISSFLGVRLTGSGILSNPLSRRMSQWRQSRSVDYPLM